MEPEIMTKDTTLDFPKNPFEDVNPSDFNKLNKKEVTEDFVAENFRLLGWDIYKPFTDSGIDRIIIKYVCPNGHTPLNQSLSNNKCKECNASPIQITRFIQVKTRRLVNNTFGFTLKSKDIRIDPRHVYLLYSDNTTDDKQDFLIVPVKELLSFFDKNNINPFSSKSFRRGNNKLNSLYYDADMDKWDWNRVSWENFRNVNGLKLLQAPNMDLNISREIKETRDLANKLQNYFTRGQSYSKDVETIVNNELSKKIRKYADKTKILETRATVNLYLKKNCNSETLESSRKYFENVKLNDTLGDVDDE